MFQTIAISSNSYHFYSVFKKLHINQFGCRKICIPTTRLYVFSFWRLQTKEENGISVGVQTELEELDKPADRDTLADTSNGKKCILFLNEGLFHYFFFLIFFPTLIP